MGCNYYISPRDPCPCCKRPYDTLHLGKASYGWEFLFATYPDANIVGVQDWRDEMVDRKIIDEYGAEIPHEVFWQMVEESRGKRALDKDVVWAWEARQYEYRDTEGYRMNHGHEFS